MTKAETMTTRAPRGSKPVTQAFLAALDEVPEASRTAVAKAAQAMIRDELKARREKTKATAARLKGRKPTSEAKPTANVAAKSKGVGAKATRRRAPKARETLAAD